MAEDRRYRAFISYSHADQKVARWLHGAIENYRVPKTLVGSQGENGPISRRLGQVFRDEEELAGAAELGPKLEEPLLKSDALIVICSQKAAASRWVDHEIRFFKQNNPGKPVLAVIAEGAPGGAENCFPESLLYAVTPEGELDKSVSQEPLAPDLQKLDHTTVKLKLIAGLLGVAYDDLARRELKRARQRTTTIVATATTIIIALSASTGVAFWGWNRAVKQQGLAEDAAAAILKGVQVAPDDCPPITPALAKTTKP